MSPVRNKYFRFLKCVVFVKFCLVHEERDRLKVPKINKQGWKKFIRYENAKIMVLYFQITEA